MTWTDDYPGDMSAVGQIDDATAERLLAGRQVTAELEPIAAVVRALREVSAEPVRPSAELGRQMAAGEFSGTPVYSYQPPPGPGLARRARRVVVAAVTTPGRLRLPARLAAAGAAVALVGAGTAGFAGTLPDPVQNRFESVVESVSPYEFPAKAADPDRRGDRVPQEQENEPGGGVTGPPESPDNLGGEVSEDANDKDKDDKDKDNKDKDNKDKDKDDKDKDDKDKDDKDKDKGRPDDLPPPAQDAPGQSGD